MKDYILFNTALSAWVGRAGGISDWRKAKVMSHAEAMEAADRYVTDRVIAFPVAVQDLETLDAER